jgi:murein DD-endopeptidase MepM/ murein hydrolase activator NlpD
MAITTTREQRASRYRTMRILAMAVLAVAAWQWLGAASPMAQVKAPYKQQFRPHAKVAQKADPTDTHADQLNAKWLSEHQQGVQLPASSATAASSPSEEEQVSTIPSAPFVHGSRALITSSLKLVKADSTAAAFNSVPGGAGLPALKDVAQAFAGFVPNGRAKVELVQGQTTDGLMRPLFVSLGEGKTERSYWWFAPPDQPDGWFDDHGQRLGGTALTDPKPGARISSPFGRRTYYGRITSTAFHNGIDFEGKTGEPIYAAADGVINHMGWYFNYGRTVKITHADNFETLYAHMSRFAPHLGPGSHVKKGDLIGFVGSTGRSTGPHLHFSTIVNGQFVDPAPYLSEAGDGQLSGGALVAFRQWQQDIRTAVDAKKAAAKRTQYHNMQGGDYWSQSPFTQMGTDHRL